MPNPTELPHNPNPNPTCPPRLLPTTKSTYTARAQYNNNNNNNTTCLALWFFTTCLKPVEAAGNGTFEVIMPKRITMPRLIIGYM